MATKVFKSKKSHVDSIMKNDSVGFIYIDHTEKFFKLRTRWIHIFKVLDNISDKVYCIIDENGLTIQSISNNVASVLQANFDKDIFTTFNVTESSYFSFYPKDMISILSHHLKGRGIVWKFYKFPLETDVEDREDICDISRETVKSEVFIVPTTENIIYSSVINLTTAACCEIMAFEEEVVDMNYTASCEVSSMWFMSTLSKLNITNENPYLVNFNAQNACFSMNFEKRKYMDSTCELISTEILQTSRIHSYNNNAPTNVVSVLKIKQPTNTDMYSVSNIKLFDKLRLIFKKIEIGMCNINKNEVPIKLKCIDDDNLMDCIVYISPYVDTDMTPLTIDNEEVDV